MQMRNADNLLPFRDPGEGGPVDTCAVCGREIYGIGAACHYCARFFP